MRVQIYDEEVTGECTIVEKVADTGKTFHGVRLFLASSDVLHNTPQDDDRSAITFWWEANNTSERSKVHDILDLARVLVGQSR